MKSFVVIAILLISSCFCYTVADDECVSRNACSCAFPNGTGYDLSSLTAVGKVNFLESQIFGNMTYLFHPCEDTDLLPERNATGNCKAEKYSICAYNATENNFTVIGSAKYSTFKAYSESRAYLIYKSSVGVTTIRLVCSNSNEDYLYSNANNLDNDTDTNLILFSQHGCRILLYSPEGMSTGSLLLVTFLVIVIGYLGIGIAVKYFLIGARGIEVIPNIGFWRDLPSLIGDGIRFMQNGCRPRSSDFIPKSPNQDSYISI